MNYVRVFIPTFDGTIGAHGCSVLSETVAVFPEGDVPEALACYRQEAAEDVPIREFG